MIADATEPAALLARIEQYYDGVPRTVTRTEEIGPFTLFIAEGAAWPYYARPRLGGVLPFTAADVARVRQRQQALGVPEAFEWVHEVTPNLGAAARAAGLSVQELPLMALTATPPLPNPPSGVTLRLLQEGDRLTPIAAVAATGFGVPGTAGGPEGVTERDAAAEAIAPERVAAIRQQMRAGRMVSAAAFTGEGPVATGSHQPLDGVSEVVGVATLPAFRRRGIAAALTALLVADAGARGCHTVFLSAGSLDVARIYAGLGFRTVATACIAGPEQA